MTSNLVLHGEVVQNNWCQTELGLTPASKKLLDSKKGKLKSPLKEGLLRIKPNQYCHRRELLEVGKHVSVTVKLSFYRYSKDPEFKPVTSEGISVSPILV